MPSAVPAPAIKPLSTSKPPNNFFVPAPNARRMANSRCRAAFRLTNSNATLPHAIASTSSTIPKSTRSGPSNSSFNLSTPRAGLMYNADLRLWPVCLAYSRRQALLHIAFDSRHRLLVMHPRLQSPQQNDAKPLRRGIQSLPRIQRLAPRSQRRAVLQWDPQVRRTPRLASFKSRRRHPYHGERHSLHVHRAPDRAVIAMQPRVPPPVAHYGHRSMRAFVLRREAPPQSHPHLQP